MTAGPGEDPRERIVGPGEGGLRLDQWLQKAEPADSRTRWQQRIREGRVLVDGRPAKAHAPVREGQRVRWTRPEPVPSGLVPENRPLRILHEDDDLLVLDKPPGWVVHPGAGHETGTLVHALLHHCGDSLAGIGGERRPGIVHRLDQDTSGVLVVAKTEPALRELARQFKERAVLKEYLALVVGRVRPPAGRIETTLGRHPAHRLKMSVGAPGGRTAVTAYETLEELSGAALLRVRLETGRTHQIRVHLAHLGCPVAGDTLYGRNAGAVAAPRQMLHAARIAFTHPRTGRRLELSAPLPEDFRAALETLRGAGRGLAPASCPAQGRRPGSGKGPGTRRARETPKRALPGEPRGDERPGESGEIGIRSRGCREPADK